MLSTETILSAVFGIELSESESEALYEVLCEQAKAQGDPVDGLLECMLALDVDQNDQDTSGFHYNPGYRHALGVVMGESGYADAPKLVAKPPSKFQKRFDSEHKAHCAALGLKRRPKAILVTQQRMAAP